MPKYLSDHYIKIFFPDVNDTVITKSPKLAYEFTQKLINELQHTHSHELTDEHLRVIKILVERYLNWIIKDNPGSLGYQHVKQFDQVLDACTQLVRNCEYHQIRFIFDAETSQALMKIKKSAIYTLKQTLTVMVDTFDASKIKKLTVDDHLDLIQFIHKILNHHYTKQSSLDEINLIAETIHPKVRELIIRIRKHASQQILNDRCLIEDQKEYIGVLYEHLLISLDYLLTRNYSLNFRNTLSARVFLNLMEEDLADLLKRFRDSEVLLSKKQVDSLEQYFNQKIELTLSHLDSNASSDEVEALKDDLSHLYQKYKHLDKTSLLFKTLLSFERIADYYVRVGDVKNSVAQLERLGLCQESLARHVKTTDLHQQLNYYLSEELKRVKTKISPLWLKTNDLIKTNYLDYLKQKELCSYEVIDFDLYHLKLSPKILERSHLYKNTDAIHSIFKKELKVTKSIIKNGYILRNLTQKTAKEFQQHVDNVCLKINGLFLEKELQNTPMVDKVLPLEPTPQTRPDVKLDVLKSKTEMPPVIEATPKTMTAKKTSNPEPTIEPQSVIVTKDALIKNLVVELPQTYEISRRNIPNDLYTVTLDSKIKKQIRDDELLKIHHILYEGKIGLKSAFAPGIFFFDVSKSKKGIKKQFAKSSDDGEQKDKKCTRKKKEDLFVKLKISGDLRLFGKVESKEVDGKTQKTILLSELTRNVH